MATNKEKNINNIEAAKSVTSKRAAEKQATGKQVTGKREECITIEGARVNNLKDISLKIPRNKLVVISGISGSGKSSLAFETLFAEGQRRFAESLSSFARQFLGRMTKPSVDKIEGIPPAIAIQQKVNTRNPRSTVGTNTEIYDYLRLLFTKIGRTYSPISGCEVKMETVSDVLRYIKEFEAGTAVYVVAPIGWEMADTRIEKLLALKDAGFNRLYAAAASATPATPAASSPAASAPAASAPATSAYAGATSGVAVRIDNVLQQMDKYAEESVYLLIDRLIINSDLNTDEETATRISDSLQAAFTEGNGHLKIISTLEGATQERNFSNIFEADGIRFEEPTELMFSYNNPLGACPVCGGYGSIVGIDESLVIPNPSLSIYEGAIACWRGEIMGKFLKELIMNASKFNFPIHRPYAQLTQEEKDILWEGNQYFTGINGFFEMVESMKYKIQYKYMLSRYSGKTTCRACHGSRLRKESEYVKINGKNITQLMNMSIKELREFFTNISLDKYEMDIAERAIKEIVSRLDYIIAVGLGYLTLSRPSNTLSGGESQRINLVSSLGSSLVGSLYILDEPSIGLHPRDTARLISVIQKLKELGNTVVIVEHDGEIISSADHLIDIGPLAGVHGGEVVYSGTIADGLEKCAAIKAAANSNAAGYCCMNAPEADTTGSDSTTSGSDATASGSTAADLGSTATTIATTSGSGSGSDSSSASGSGSTVATATAFSSGSGSTAVAGSGSTATTTTTGSAAATSGSLTLDYLSGLKKMPARYNHRSWKHSIKLNGCMEHNLKGINAEFPLGVFTVVTGVSGSGKSSLVGDTLYPALNKHFNQFTEKPGAFKELEGNLDKISSIEYIDQNPIGKSTRSNPVTYLKIYDDIRKLYSEQPYAKMNGYGHSHFSFNIDGGRCPQCLGEGFITIPMQFMAEVTMVCEECGGKRFKPDILEVKYKEKSINDVLNMSVEEAIQFFGGQKETAAKRIAEKLKVLDDVGLGYIQLGQSSSSLSGGESQRIKLAQFLSKDSGKNIVFIFDEPTTGLHFHDIGKLLKAFDNLIEKGHTIIVVEHNLDVIKSADWVIDLGPDGGDNGGEIVFTGTPTQLAQDNRWKEFLK